MVDILTNYTLNESYQPLKMIDCGTIQADVFSRVGLTVKIASGIIIGLLIFQWWAISKVMTSKEDDDRKQFLVSMIQTFITGVILLLSFIIFYWLVLAGIEP